mgnify:FL=1
MSKHSYIRINAKGDCPMDFVNLADSVPKDEVWNELKATMSHHDKGRISFGSRKFALWCSDGKRYNVDVLFDDDGIHKCLAPNHVMNAMVDAGRFTDKEFNFIGKSHNQDIKEMWGSNYFVGDVIIKVITGKPIPDCSIFGDNPIVFLRSHKKVSNKMRRKYGDSAEDVINPFKKKVMPTGMVSADDFKNAPWEKVGYAASREDIKEADEVEYCAKYCRCGCEWDFEDSDDEDGESKYCPNCCPRIECVDCGVCGCYHSEYDPCGTNCARDSESESDEEVENEYETVKYDGKEFKEEVKTGRIFTLEGEYYGKWNWACDEIIKGIITFPMKWEDK